MNNIQLTVIFLSLMDGASDETLLLPSLTDKSVPCLRVQALEVPQLTTYLSVLLLSVAVVAVVVVVVTEDLGKGC